MVYHISTKFCVLNSLHKISFPKELKRCKIKAHSYQESRKCDSSSRYDYSKTKRIREIKRVPIACNYTLSQSSL